MRVISLSRRWLSSFVAVAGLSFVGMNTSYAVTLVDGFDTSGGDQLVRDTEASAVPGDWIAEQFTGVTAVGGTRDLLVQETPNSGVASAGIELLVGPTNTGAEIASVDADTDVTGLAEIQWDGDDAANPGDWSNGLGGLSLAGDRISFLGVSSDNPNVRATFQIRDGSDIWEQTKAEPAAGDTVSFKYNDFTGNGPLPTDSVDAMRVRFHGVGGFNDPMPGSVDFSFDEVRAVPSPSAAVAGILGLAWVGGVAVYRRRKMTDGA
jgi:hypothetical protein